MENLPKNVINKIMFYTSHPIADILKTSSIFKTLELNNRDRYHGCPYGRGGADAYYGRGYDRTSERLLPLLRTERLS